MMISPEHFPGAIPEIRPWPGRGAVKGVSPGGAGHPIPHVYRRNEDGVWPCERPAPEGSFGPLTAGSPPRPTLSGGMAPGSGLHRHPVNGCRLLVLSLGCVLYLVGEVMIMEKEVDQFMFHIVDAVEKVVGRFPLGQRCLFGYAPVLGSYSGGEAKYVCFDWVPSRVRNDVKRLMNESDFRQVVHYFRIRFRDLPRYDFWVVVFGMGHVRYFPIIIVYKDGTLISYFYGWFLL